MRWNLELDLPAAGQLEKGGEEAMERAEWMKARENE